LTDGYTERNRNASSRGLLLYRWIEIKNKKLKTPIKITTDIDHPYDAIVKIYKLLGYYTWKYNIQDLMINIIMDLCECESSDFLKKWTDFVIALKKEAIAQTELWQKEVYKLF